ncbi:diguanylate cyclase [Geomonas sp. Red32]|nr:diguanylate cyclase [Geomonas sp. Red32]
MKKDPDALLRLFSVTAMVSIVIILLLAGFGFREGLERFVESAAEEDATSISSALLSEERDKIIAPYADGGSYMHIDPADLPRLDQHLRQFLAPFGIVKIKIYSNDCRIIYSTETGIIGMTNLNNKRLNHALTGVADSKFEKKEDVHDLAKEQRLAVDVVETYIPVKDKQNKVIGCFEIYQDVTSTWTIFKNSIALLVGILFLILMVAFGLSFIVIRKATRSVREIQQAIRKQAITDPLTGLLNKRQILHTAGTEFARARRRREKGMPDAEVAFIMVDIDQFKEVNDRYGHLAGDHLLKEVSDRISTSLRGFDAVGRFGGDEFLIILPNTNLDEACLVARKIWMLVREEPFVLEGDQVRGTVSIGVATSQAGDTSYTDAMKRADDGLYRAKSGGRDRIGEQAEVLGT